MTQKKEANELVDKFIPDLTYTNIARELLNRGEAQKRVKQCALICIGFALSIGVSPLDTKELKEMKQEINKL